MGIAPLLSEAARDLVEAQIKANISTALTDVRSSWPDAVVSTEPPRSYFIYEGAHTYQCPAIFMVVTAMDFPEDELNPNHINAIVRMGVSVVIEDREAKLLTLKAERYLSALFQCLHRVQLEDTGKNIKIYTRVTRSEYSPLFTRKGREGEGMFRKEASIELEIKHWENPTSY